MKHLHWFVDRDGSIEVLDNESPARHINFAHTIEVHGTVSLQFLQDESLVGVISEPLMWAVLVYAVLALGLHAVLRG